MSRLYRLNYGLCVEYEVIKVVKDPGAGKIDIIGASANSSLGARTFSDN